MTFDCKINQLFSFDDHVDSGEDFSCLCTDTIILQFDLFLLRLTLNFARAKSRAGRQGPKLRLLDRLDRSSKV